jgi:hypothetical protein
MRASLAICLMTPLVALPVAASLPNIPAMRKS